MKKINFQIKYPTAKRGFTLTEVLLAVMIVGLIGVALAALSRSAAREGGVGRSRIVLRNNLASFMRTLRNDLAGATRVSPVGTLSLSDTTPVAVLQIAKQVDRDGNALGNETPERISYCFVRGSDNTNIVPAEAYRGGHIHRIVLTGNATDYPDCTSFPLTDQNLVLPNVKYIPAGTTEPTYPVPLFTRDTFSRDFDTSSSGVNGSLLTVNIITELDSRPIVNDVVEETFAGPMGY